MKRLVLLSVLLAGTLGAQSVPTYMGQCMMRSTDGATLTQENITSKKVYLVCNQPICVAPAQAILNLTTGSTLCTTTGAPQAPTGLTVTVN